MHRNRKRKGSLDSGHLDNEILDKYEKKIKQKKKAYRYAPLLID
jgi:hypothetical protein